MGLGKTVQALAICLANPPKDPKVKTTLVVAPISLLYQVRFFNCTLMKFKILVGRRNQS